MSENRISNTATEPRSGHAASSSADPESTHTRTLPAPGSGIPDVEQMISRYPLASILGSFGIGFGLGVLGVALLAHQQEEERWPRRSRRWLESRGMPGSVHELASSLKRVRDSITEHLPESIYRG